MRTICAAQETGCREAAESRYYAINRNRAWIRPCVVLYYYYALKSRGRGLQAAGDDLQGVQLRVELAGDAVEKPDRPSHEEELRRDFVDALAEAPSELPEPGPALLAAEQHAYQAKQGIEVRVRSPLVREGARV